MLFKRHREADCFARLADRGEPVKRRNVQDVPPRIDALRAVAKRDLAARLKRAIVDFLDHGTGREADQLDDLVAGSVRERVARPCVIVSFSSRMTKSAAEVQAFGRS
jgi:hypothetical protein